MPVDLRRAPPVRLEKMPLARSSGYIVNRDTSTGAMGGRCAQCFSRIRPTRRSADGARRESDLHPAHGRLNSVFPVMTSRSLPLSFCTDMERSASLRGLDRFG